MENSAYLWRVYVPVYKPVILTGESDCYQTQGVCVGNWSYLSKSERVLLGLSFDYCSDFIPIMHVSLST